MEEVTKIGDVGYKFVIVYLIFLDENGSLVQSDRWR
jgi:hypothetical protein